MGNVITSKRGELNDSKNSSWFHPVSRTIHSSFPLPSLYIWIHHFFSGLYCNGPLTAILIGVNSLRHKSGHMMFLPEILWLASHFATVPQPVHRTFKPRSDADPAHLSGLLSWIIPPSHWADLISSEAQFCLTSGHAVHYSWASLCQRVLPSLIILENSYRLCENELSPHFLSEAFLLDSLLVQLRCSCCVLPEQPLLFLVSELSFSLDCTADKG